MRLARYALTLSIAVLILTPGMTGAPAAAQRSQPRAEGYHATLERLVGTAHVPGGVLLVRSHGRVWLGATGLADVARHVQMRVDDRFRIASISKPFLSTVVEQLASEGRLSLDDTVERWLPGLVPNGSEVTIRELLNHTAGLPDYAELPSVLALYRHDPTHVISPRELVRLAYANPIAVETPGSVFEYSNTNYVVAGLVVEAATGAPLADAIASRILQPVGLDHTLTPPDAAIPAPFAHGYTSVPDLWIPPRGHRLDVTRVDPSLFAGAGALVSDAHDLARFIDALFGGTLLPARQLAEMTALTRVTSDPNGRAQGYGLGLYVIRTPCGPAYGHWGHVPGYSSTMFRSRDGTRTAVLLLNGTIPTRKADISTDGQLFAAFCR